MVSRFIADLERPVSRVRLENYRPTNPTTDDDLAMVVNYFHNIELSEALYPSLEAFEVALRNSIHLALSQHFQNVYWFDQAGFYPKPRPPVAEPRQMRLIREARDHLAKEGKPDDADRIVAELNFGFWHALLNRPFERTLWRPNRAALLGQVFPHTTRRQRDRQALWDRVDRIRIIRNRVMHYEPIWYRPHLAQDHADILDALGWISTAMQQTIAMCDRFPTVLTSGRATIERRILMEIQRRYATV